jgi:hypothetical protein
MNPNFDWWEDMLFDAYMRESTEEELEQDDLEEGELEEAN